MPAFLVHGVPDTDRVWEGVTASLHRTDVFCLSLPGFGCPRPPGFGATKTDYAAWLVEQLAAIDGPVDLVGHDWGGMIALRAASLAPERIRSWAIGGAPVDPDYTWHRLARLWQMPVIGELVMAGFTEPRMRRALLDAAVPEPYASGAAGQIDRTMKGCVLALYRSARRVGQEWSPGLGRIRAPGLVLWGEHDPYAAPRFGETLARRTGARFERFDGCGHWWQCERPVEVAAALDALWRSLDEDRVH